MRPQRGPGQLSWDGQKAEIGFGPSSRGPYMAYTIYLGGPKSTALLSCYVSAPGRQETDNSKTYFLWLTGTVVIPQRYVLALTHALQTLSKAPCIKDPLSSR